MPLEDLLRDPAPTFICKGFRSQRRLVVPLQHVAEPPARSTDVEQLPDVPGASFAAAFYAKHNGLSLFKAPSPFKQASFAGLFIFPLTDWTTEAAQWRRDWVEWWPDYLSWDWAYRPEDAVPVAQCVGAANYVHWIIRGPLAGTIQWWPWTMPVSRGDLPLTGTFEGFCNLVAANPARVDELLGGYLIYSDGRTDDQWHPSSYVADHRALTTDREGYLIESPA
jgi:hypothetical protein